MKPQINQPQCEKYLESPETSRSVFAWLSLSVHAMTSSMNSLMQDAPRICQAGQTAYRLHLHRLQTSSAEAWSNKRFRLGVAVGLVALPSWMSHLYFNINTRIEGWYYVNYVFYFNTIRPYLALFFLVTGFFIAAPTKWKFKWWAIPVAVFCVSEIISESFYNNWQDFYNPMPMWQWSLILLVCLPAVYVSADYLLYRKYHLKDGNVARIKGIIKTPGIDAHQKVTILEQLIKESENYNAIV